MTPKLKILASGSSGNCALIYDSRGKCVMLDMGLPWQEILQGLNYDLASVSLALASHNHHSDHTKSIVHCINSGIPTFSNQDVCDHYKGCQLLDRMIKVEGFKVQTFELAHNVPNNAFIVDTPDNIRVLYCTDTQYIPRRVKGVNIAIIECNYDNDTLLDNACEGVENRSQYENHQSLDTCIDYLKEIYNKDLTKIILWHPSSTNLNKNEAVQKVKNEIGLSEVYMAEKGLELEISNTEF